MANKARRNRQKRNVRAADEKNVTIKAEAGRKKKENIERHETRVRDCMMRANDEMEIKEYAKAAEFLKEAQQFANLANAEMQRVTG